VASIIDGKRESGGVLGSGRKKVFIGSGV